MDPNDSIIKRLWCACMYGLIPGRANGVNSNNNKNNDNNAGL